ncbi:MAG: sigma-54 factor interaction domain-containing protein [Spirochaetota bacterium]|nr:sigma-54 factor interaction domain-containing protein [Spirochaetota bacterium]
MNTCEPFITPDCQACSLQNVVGISEQIFNCLKKAGMILNNDEPVLITGESGTGKELFARALHYSDCCKRRLEPFITKNCSGIDSNVLSSELFGHENGGALDGKNGYQPGLFEAAQGGTLFLDEIGDISMDTQKALLRTIEEKRLYRIGVNENEI